MQIVNITAEENSHIEICENFTISYSAYYIPRIGEWLEFDEKEYEVKKVWWLNPHKNLKGVFIHIHMVRINY